MSAYYSELSSQLAKIVSDFRGENVCVIGHARPDGDCIGSSVALTRMLRSQGVNVTLVNADSVPETIEFLVGETPVERFSFEAVKYLPLIYVDCADEMRVGPLTSRSLSESRRLLNIDHHISNTLFAETNLVDSDSAATCEVLAGIAFDLEWEVDAVTAQALYVGILTDTGQFCYASTSSRVFDICSRLLKLGARPEVAADHLFESQPLCRYKLLERYLDSLELYSDGRVCCGVLMQKDFNETGASYEDTEAFVDYARSLKGVEIGIIVEERKTMTKGSLRAKHADVRVDQVAGLFGGGGHARAAGLSSPLSVDDLKAGLLEEVDRRISANK